MSDAEAMPVASRSPWWLQTPLDAHFRLARVHVKPGSNNKCRGVSVPVPAISQALGGNADAKAMPGASRSPWWLQAPLDAQFKLARVQVKPGSNNKCRGVSVPVPAISQALGGNADAEAMPGASRSPWWLKMAPGA